MKKKTSNKSTPSFVDKLPKHIKDRLIHLAEIDLYITLVSPESLKDNPLNWRIHTQRQKTTYSAFKNKYGWLGFVIYNIRLQRLVDGHMRVEQAIKDGEPFVPVILKDLEEQQEKEVLATYDSIGLLAQQNTEALKSLVEGNKKALSTIKNDSDRKLAQLNKDLEQMINAEGPKVLLPQAKTRIRPTSPPETKEEETEDDTETEEGFVPRTEDPVLENRINDDVFFEASNWMGIPDLDVNKLATPDMAPVRTFARDSYGKDAYYCVSCAPFEGEVGTLGFYTEDWRFEDAYRDGATFAEFLQDLDPYCLITPDFSTYHAWPAMLRLYSIYRSRWCGRFWQELGFYIIPTLQWADKYELTKKYVLETLPAKCPVVSVQCRRMGTGKDQNVEPFIKFIKFACDIVKPELILLYGGEEKQKYLHGYMPKGPEYRYLPQFMSLQRKKLKRKKYVDQD